MPEKSSSSAVPQGANVPRIVLDPDVLAGKLIIRGTRVSVELVLGFFAAGWTFDDLLQNYPMLTREDLLAYLQFAHERVQSERVFPIAG